MHRILRKYGVPLVIVPGVLLVVSLSTITLAPVTTAPSHSGSRVATLTDYDQSITAQDATFSVVENGTLNEPAQTLQIGATDTDTNATCCTVTADPTAPGTSGTVTFDANGDGGFSYSPDSGFTGTDTFGFILTDTDGNTAGGTVTIDVNPVTVTASDASYVTAQGTEFFPPEGTLQINDSDDNPDSGASCCTAMLTAAPSNGTVTVNASGSFAYTPASGFSGTDTFQYSLSDSDGNVSAPADVTITVGSSVEATKTAIVYDYPPVASASVPVTFAAEVTTEDHGPAPTGIITFAWYKPEDKAGQGPLTGTIGTAPLSAGRGTLTTQPGDLPAGVDGSITITAIYSGDSSNASSAGAIFYLLQRTCDEGQWTPVSNGIPVVTSPGNTKDYYIGQSNGWFSVYVSGTAKFTGYIKTNGLILYLSSTRDKSADHFLIKGKNAFAYSITDKGHVYGFSFYPGCASRISFHLDINGAKAPTSVIFLGNPPTNATKNPVVLTRFELRAPPSSFEGECSNGHYSQRRRHPRRSTAA